MMSKVSLALLVLILSAILVACGAPARDPLFSTYLTEAVATGENETAVPISTPEVLASPTATTTLVPPTPTTPVENSTDSPTLEASAVPLTATASASPTPTKEASPTATATSVPTATPTALPTAIPSPASPAPLPAPPLNPAGQVGLGAYLEGTPYDGFAAVRRFVGLVGHRTQYVLWFQAWGEDDRDFPGYWIAQAATIGATPVITWEPWQRDFANPAAEQPAYSLASIAAGEHDAYIRTWAQGSAASGVPIIIRFAHEQSTEPGVRSWYPWQGDPEAYRAAFRHIVALFREAGASNVQFLWSAMWLDSWAAQYYPGGDVVDLVGTTVLNHGTAVSTPWAQWRTFDELFAGQYGAATGWGKPIILTELATAEQGGDKAAWLRDMLTALPTRYPLVSGLLLLEVESDREWPDINWSVGSSPESLAVFRELISGPHFK